MSDWDTGWISPPPRQKPGREHVMSTQVPPLTPPPLAGTA